MKTEDIEYLELNKSYILCAHNNGYVRSLPYKIAERFFSIADSEHIKHGNISCHKCVYDVCDALYKYLSFNETVEDSNINTLEEEDNAPEQTKTIQEPAIEEDQPKKRAGRPKKTNN